MPANKIMSPSGVRFEQLCQQQPFGPRFMKRGTPQLEHSLCVPPHPQHGFLGKRTNAPIPYPRHSIPRYLYKGSEGMSPQNGFYKNVHCSFFILAKNRKHLRCVPIGEYIRKIWYIHIMCDTLQLKTNKMLIYSTM